MATQQLVNAFMKLTSKAGAGNLVRELIGAVDGNGNPKDWTMDEMTQAVDFINMQVERFGKAEAIQVIQTLMKKYNVSTDELSFPATDTLDEMPGVQGLQ